MNGQTTLGSALKFPPTSKNIQQRIIALKDPAASLDFDIAWAN
jgi:hypothetical protein